MFTRVRLTLRLAASLEVEAATEGASEAGAVVVGSVAVGGEEVEAPRCSCEESSSRSPTSSQLRVLGMYCATSRVGSPALPVSERK